MYEEILSRRLCFHVVKLHHLEENNSLQKILFAFQLTGLEIGFVEVGIDLSPISTEFGWLRIQSMPINDFFVL